MGPPPGQGRGDGNYWGDDSMRGGPHRGGHFHRGGRGRGGGDPGFRGRGRGGPRGGGHNNMNGTLFSSLILNVFAKFADCAEAFRVCFTQMY